MGTFGSDLRFADGKRKSLGEVGLRVRGLLFWAETDTILDGDTVA